MGPILYSYLGCIELFELVATLEDHFMSPLEGIIILRIFGIGMFFINYTRYVVISILSCISLEV